MILINLMPHREAALKQFKQLFFIKLGLSAMGGVVICTLISFGYSSQSETQREKNNLLRAEAALLDKKITNIATLKVEIAALKERQDAVEGLQGDRNLPVFLMNEMVRKLPDGVYITSLKEDSQGVLITGISQSSDRIAELIRNFSSDSPWFYKPELIEITAGTVTLGLRDQRKISNFSMRVSIKRKSDIDQKKASPGNPSVNPSVNPSSAAAEKKTNASG